jgi:hypothetical protein
MGLGRWTCDAIDAGLDARSHVRRAVELGTSVRAGVGRARWGASGLEAERARAGGRYAGVPRVISAGVSIGNGVFHGDADRAHALEILGSGFDALEADLSRAIATRVHSIETEQDHERAAALLQWWNVHVRAAIAEFRAFVKNEQASWITRFATSWDTFEAWRDRLIRLRENARIQGVALASPEPPPLPQTVTEQGATGTGSPFAALWTAIKLVLYAAAGFVGVVGLVHVARDLQRGHNPALELAA